MAAQVARRTKLRRQRFNPFDHPFLSNPKHDDAAGRQALPGELERLQHWQSQSVLRVVGFWPKNDASLRRLDLEGEVRRQVDPARARYGSDQREPGLIYSELAQIAEIRRVVADDLIGLPRRLSDARASRRQKSIDLQIRTAPQLHHPTHPLAKGVPAIKSMKPSTRFEKPERVDDLGLPIIDDLN